jgi:hypothetical protein
MNLFIIDVDLNRLGNIRACTFCHSFAAQMETGDLKQGTKSIKELMKRLSLMPCNNINIQIY